MRSVLVIVSVLIVYGSLYPFDFRLPPDYPPHMVIGALFTPFATTRGDLLGNIALFVPFGFVGILAMPRGWGRIGQLSAVITSGVLLAFLVQLAQIVVPDRDPSLIDVDWNTLGVIAGAAGASMPFSRRLLSSIGGAVSFEIPVILAGIWLAGELMPLVPSLDLQLLRQNLKPLLLAPELRPGEALLQFAAWLTALQFLWTSKLLKNWRFLLPALPFAAMGAQLFIVSNSLSFSELVGGIGAAAVWLAARNTLRPAFLAALLVIGILMSNLYPLDFSTPRNGFSWVPFSDFLEGSMVANAGAFVRKAFLYGALIWTLRTSGISWRTAAISTAAMLLVQEVLQIYVRGASAGLTDPILAVLMAIAMAAASRGLERAPVIKPDGAIDIIPVREKLRDIGRLDQPVSSWHLGSLDGLRGLAALAVFGVHFNQAANLHGRLGPFDLNRFLTNGNTGVALFFVLSGFLLSIPFWRARQNTGTAVDTKAYALRRIARIVPAYYFCLFVILSAKALNGGYPSFNDLLSHLVFLHNLKDYSILSINPPFWTLAVEMQFYLLLPLLFLALKPFPSRVSFALVLALSVGAYLANYALNSYLVALNHWPIDFPLIWPFAVAISGPGSFVLTYSTLGHLTYFLIGISAAWLFLKSGGLNALQRPALNRDVLFWISAALLAVILSTPLDDLLQLPFGHYNWPIGPFLLAVMVFSAPQSLAARAVLDHGPIRWLGLISYGVYIYHYPVLRITQAAMGTAHLGVTPYWFLFGGASFATTIMLASLSYIFLEKPIMQMARRRRPVQKEAMAPRLKSTRPHLKSNGWAEVPIGLRSEHLTYLERVSNDRTRSISSATRHIIAQFIDRLSQEGTDKGPLGGGLSQDLIHAGRHRGREHQHIVNLPNDYVEFLSGLSDKLGTTMSRTVQMIVDDFITENMDKEKAGPSASQ